MARKLPWSSTAEPAPKRQRTAEPTGRPSPSVTAEPENKSRDDSRGRASTKKPARRNGSRTPSSSPVPSPPTAIEPMIQGYGADDGWMMVEDEFQTLAQSLTRHLHHAEYKRLMKKAKDAPRKSLPEPTSHMSEKTRQKLHRDGLATRQKDTLDRVIPGHGMKADTETEADKIEDPWRSTHLAGLMSGNSPEKKSLRGLERLPSSTRAAQGFSSSQSVGSVQATASNGNPMIFQNGEGATRMSSRSSKNDLTASSRSREISASRPQSSVPSATDRKESVDQRALRHSSASTEKSGLPPKKPDSPSSLLKKRKANKEKSKEERLAEIPLFLA